MGIRRIIARVALAGAMLIAVVGLGLATAPATQAAPAITCMKIDPSFSGMSAAIINPTAPVTGTVDATSCDVGVYYGPNHHSTVSGAKIFGATAFGVIVDSANVTIRYTHVYDILGAPKGGCEEGGEDGEMALAAPGGGEQREYTGCKHGTGILVTGLHGHASIYGSSVWAYGRRGVSVSGPYAWASITGDWIDGSVGGRGTSGKNGVWIANGAGAIVSGNTIENNARPSSEGPASNGVMVAGGACHSGQPNFTRNIQITWNKLYNNSTGVLLTNLNGVEGNPIQPTSVTNNHVEHNYIRGGSSSQAESTAGVLVAGGKRDKVAYNTIVDYLNPIKDNGVSTIVIP